MKLPLPTGEPDPVLPKGLFRYVLRVSGRHQIVLLLLSVAVFLLSAVPLEIQRRVVNDAFRNGAAGPIIWLALAYLGVALLQGGIKLVLNVYRAWVSEAAVLALRRLVAQDSMDQARNGASARAQATVAGTEASMMLSEVEPIGGFVGISVSEPVLQSGILLSVFGYLLFLQPMLALLCLAAFSPQLLFVPLLQRAINRRTGDRIEVLRGVGGSIVDAQRADAAADVAQEQQIERVFALDMGIFQLKYSMNFLMNLMHHLGVAMALGAGGYLVVQGRIEVGTVVAFVSGLDKVNDPWGDRVNWFREMTLAQTRDRLLAQGFETIAGGTGQVGVAIRPMP